MNRDDGMVTSATLQALAELLAGDCFEAPRGAFWLDESQQVVVVFGNDDVPVELLTAEQIHRRPGRQEDPDWPFAPGQRSSFEVASIRRVLAESSVARELGFATAGITTWVLACSPPARTSPLLLEFVAWIAWVVVTDSLAAGRGVPAPLGVAEVRRELERQEALEEAVFRELRGQAAGAGGQVAGPRTPVGFIPLQMRAAHDVLERHGFAVARP
jgi:hypothetical protein